MGNTLCDVLSSWRSNGMRHAEPRENKFIANAYVQIRGKRWRGGVNSTLASAASLAILSRASYIIQRFAQICFYVQCIELATSLLGQLVIESLYTSSYTISMRWHAGCILACTVTEKQYIFRSNTVCLISTRNTTHASAWLDETEAYKTH